MVARPLACARLPAQNRRVEMREERRVVTALFADIVGSTALGERLEPEEFKLVIGEAVARMVAAVESFEGTVKDLAGDGVLALFGAPQAHEDDQERAIRAGLRIVDDIETFAAEVDRAWGIGGVDVRVGVNTGPVVTGALGGGSHVEYSAMGDAVNVASRLQSHASPGSVVVGAETRSAVVPLFTWGSPRELELKGKDAAVTAYEVTGVTGEAPRARSSRRSGSRIVGRERELSRGREAVDAGREGAGRIVFVTGEPGIGKDQAGHRAAVGVPRHYAPVRPRPVDRGPLCELRRNARRTRRSATCCAAGSTCVRTSPSCGFASRSAGTSTASTRTGADEVLALPCGAARPLVGHRPEEHRWTSCRPRRCSTARSRSCAALLAAARAGRARRRLGRGPALGGRHLVAVVGAVDRRHRARGLPADLHVPGRARSSLVASDGRRRAPVAASHGADGARALSGDAGRELLVGLVGDETIPEDLATQDPRTRGGEPALPRGAGPLDERRRCIDRTTTRVGASTRAVDIVVPPTVEKLILARIDRLEPPAHRDDHVRRRCWAASSGSPCSRRSPPTCRCNPP